MALQKIIDFIKRSEKSVPLTIVEQDGNMTKIEDLFPQAETTDIGKTLTLNAARNGFDYKSTTDISTLFPNGGVEVSVSRALQLSDAGKLLLIIADNVELTMPEVNPFAENDRIGIFCFANQFSIETEFGSDKRWLIGNTTNANQTVVFQMIGGALLNINSGFIYDYTNNRLCTYELYLMKRIGQVYEAIINQSGTNPPDVVYLNINDFGDITFTRIGVGEYQLNQASGLLMIQDTSFEFAPYNTNYRSYQSMFYEIIDNNTISIKTYDASGTLSDDVMTPHKIKLTVKSIN
jgi:hypothetical protein